MVSGQFTVMLNPDDGELDYMVDVMVTYDANDVTARNSSAICLMQNNDTWGVGIYVSSIIVLRNIFLHRRRHLRTPLTTLSSTN